VGRKIIVPSPDLESFSGRVRRFLIREAREELEAATHHYANKLGKRVAKISVRDTSSRWGSCVTRKGEGPIFDDVKSAKKWLNHHGAKLHAVGAEF